MNGQRGKADLEVSETFSDFGGVKFVQLSLLRSVCRGFQCKGLDICDSRLRGLEGRGQVLHHPDRNG